MPFFIQVVAGLLLCLLNGSPLAIAQQSGSTQVRESDQVSQKDLAEAMQSSLISDTGINIWAGQGAAIDNTANFLMDLLYTQAGVSHRNWNLIANRMIGH